MKFKVEGRKRGRGSWKGDSKLEGLREHCKLSSGLWGFWGKAATTLDALRAQRICLEATNVVKFPFFGLIRRNPWLPLA